MRLRLFCRHRRARLSAFAAVWFSAAAVSALENPAAATRALEKAIALLSAGDWGSASFEARLGESYAPTWADFPYVEALSSVASGNRRAESISLAERSLSESLFWRSYTRSDALRLTASLYADTLRYDEALRLLDSAGKPPTPDGDLTRLRCLYGLKRLAEARSLVLIALDRWPYDPRFPRLFLTRENALPPDKAALTAAEIIVSRLYIWEEDDRELLLLAVPFLHDPAVRVRNIREYRGMGSSDRAVRAGLSPLSTLRALEYGLLDERIALNETLDASSPVDFDILSGVISLCGTEASRARIKAFLDSFGGTVVMDRNGDGIFDTSIAYRLGRPVLAEIDPNQDGIIDYSVGCDYGKPVTIRTGTGETVVFDAYPSVREITRGAEDWELRPLSLNWKPVEWLPHDFDVGGSVFYTLEPTGTEPPLTERLLQANAFRLVRPSTEAQGGTERVLWRDGSPVSSETRLDGRLYSWTSWSGGVPALVRIDRDGDGYLETTRVNDATGSARSIAIDRDGDSRIDYREEYGTDGSSRMSWDTDENGVDEIVRAVDSGGIERVEWLHPVTGLPVTLLIEKGAPRSVSYQGRSLSVVRDPAQPLWWIGSVPPSSRDLARKVIERVNREQVPVVVFTVREDGVNLVAVSAGGLFFAERFDE